MNECTYICRSIYTFKGQNLQKKISKVCQWAQREKRMRYIAAPLVRRYCVRLSMLKSQQSSGFNPHRVQYTECQSSNQVVRIGSPHPLTRKRVFLPPFGSKGETHSLGGRGWGDPIPTMGQTLCYSRYTIISLRFNSSILCFSFKG